MSPFSPATTGFAEFCFPCLHVVARLRPVRYVSRPDGDWVFTCGDKDHDVLADWGYAHTIHLLDLDETIRELADLASNGEAFRLSVRSPWLRLQV